MISKWKISLLDTWEKIESKEFVLLWFDLLSRSDNAHVFFHPTLVGVWLETYRTLRDIRPLFVHATCGEQQVIFPLVLWTRNWKNAFIRVVVPAGHSDFDYHDPLFLHPPTRDDVISFYQDMRLTLDNSIKYDRLLIDGLHGLYLPHFSTVINSDTCFAWSLDDCVAEEGIVLPLKKRLAQDTRRRLRRLKELGSVTYRSFGRDDDPTAVSASLNIFLQMHTQRWPNAYKAPGFHHKLVEEGLRSGVVQFDEIKLDGVHVSWRICFVFQGCLGLYQPAINPDYLAYAPGHISLGFTLAKMKGTDIVKVDHLRGAEEYKNAWGGVETEIFDAIYDNKSLMSRLRIAAFNMIEKYKAYRRKTIAA